QQGEAARGAGDDRERRFCLWVDVRGLRLRSNEPEMLRVSKLLSTIFAALALSGGTAAETRRCGLEGLVIAPIEDTKLEWYIGRGKLIEIRFHNDRIGQDVEAFPEPPLKVSRADAKSACEIDGGIWVRDSVYLSADESSLLVHEYSGSSDTLV